MQNLRVLVVTMTVVLLAGCTLARYLPDYDSSRDRYKRQMADIQMGSRRARLGLGQLSPKGCTQAACGLVDVKLTGKKKRSDDFTNSEDFENVQRLRLLQKVLAALTEDSS